MKQPKQTSRRGVYEDGKSLRSASGRQLWALNVAGLLKLVPVNEADSYDNVISSADAHRAIQESIRATGDWRTSDR